MVSLFDNSLMARFVCGVGTCTLLFCFVFIGTACSTGSTVLEEEAVAPHPDVEQATVSSDEVVDAVRAVLDEQVDAWNDGDIRSFMRGYHRSDSLIFISNGTMRRGWQANLYAYVRNYPDEASMGTLSFEDITIEPLADNAALAYGIWRLEREEDEPIGLFSLVFKHTDRGWRIIHDHTSSSP